MAPCIEAPKQHNRFPGFEARSLGHRVLEPKGGLLRVLCLEGTGPMGLTP